MQTASSFTPMDVRAPWQHGRTERHGDIDKRIFELVGCTFRSCSVPAPGYGMQCCQESVQSFWLSFAASVRDWTSSTHLTSVDVHAPDHIYDLAATDASFEASRQIRDAAMKAHAEVSIRDRIESSVRARPRHRRLCGLTTSTWCGRRTRHRSVGQLQCELAATEESRGLEIQNQLLDDMKAEFPKFPGRRVYTDVEREGVPPEDAHGPPAAPRAAEEEEDRAWALIPTVPPLTSPPPSLFL